VISWLGFKPTKITYSSDNFDRLYNSQRIWVTGTVSTYVTARVSCLPVACSFFSLQDLWGALDELDLP
jgi:hypothetical protein